MSLSAFYFGCWGEPGHYLFEPSGRHCRAVQDDFPVSERGIDSTFLPPRLPQVEGRASLVHLNGWTILSFWDRSSDSRPGSNSNFLIRGTLTFEEVVTRAKYHFPKIWDRFRFEVVPYEPLTSRLEPAS